MRFLLLFLFVGCVKSPCIVAVDVTFNNGSEISATAFKKIKCGDKISFPFYPPESTGQRTAAIRAIAINFYQGARVVQADIVYVDEFKDGIFKREYHFPDTNPDLMIWKVFDVNRSGWVQYETVIK